MELKRITLFTLFLEIVKNPEAEQACDHLTEVLGTNPLLLKELDLSGKISGDSGVKLLSALLKDPLCRSEKLRLRNSSVTERSCTDLISALTTNPSHLTELDLSENTLGNAGVIQISTLLKTPSCKLHTLLLSDCSITEEGYVALVKVLKSSHLKELDLRGNDPGASGVKLLRNTMNKTKCILRLSDCSITEEGYTALAEALRSSHLIELDLRGNDPGASGVKLLTDLLQDPKHKLKTLSLLKSADAAEALRSLSKIVGEDPLLHRELDLSRKTLKTIKVKNLSALLQDPHYRLQKLTISNNPEAEQACDHLTEVLGTNPLLQKELDLSGKISGDSGVKLLSALLKDPLCRSEKLRLRNSSVTERSCTDLISALTTNPSHLTELDLSENTLGNAGVIQISTLLKTPSCKLHTLRLSDCSITEEGYTALAEALRSNPSSHLKELDLRGNDPGESGVKKLIEIQKNHKLETLRLRNSSVTERSCTDLISALTTNPSHLTELDLSENTLGNAGVIQISTLLKTPSCKLHTLLLSDCNIKHEGYAALTEALRSNPSSPLIELDLRGNHPGESGVKEIRNLMNDPEYKLKTLRLSDCSITEEGYTALAEALRSNPSSHLKELDLRGNDPGESGVKKLIEIQKNHKLETLSLLKSADAAEALRSLSKIVGEDPLLHRELDLSRKTPGDVNVKNLSALLQDPHYRLQKLTLYKEGSIKEDDCVGLFSALGLNPSHLRELNLNRNKPGESGLRNLCDFLKNPECKLQKLQLQNSISDESCADVASALCTNPSHIRDLDLSECKLGDSGVKKLCDLLKKHECKLKKLELQNSISDESCADVASALCTNPSHIRYLDLSECKLGDSGVKKLCDLLKKHECKLETLQLQNSISDESCTDVASTLCTNPSHIRYLDLSECKLGDSGVKKLCDLLKKHECKLEKLELWNSISDESCADVASALCTNPSHIRDLDLSQCELGDLGVKKLCDLLKKHECKLEKLQLVKCSITDEGGAALTEALRLNSSHLKELDLSKNKLKDSVLQELQKILQSSGGKLQSAEGKLQLLKSPDAQKSDLHLREVLGINPILQTDLDLSGKIEGDSGVEHLSALLKDPHCRPEKLQLSDCSITEEGYTALAEALRSNPSSHLKELDLRGNDPGESGVKKLIEIQKNHRLKTLSLLKSADATEALRSLSKNVGEDPLLHRELDLSRKTPGDVNMNNLLALLQDPHYRLQKLTLQKSISDESWADVASALCTNPSHIRYLDLNECKLGDSGVKKLCDLLKKHECKLETLRLKKCSISDEGGAALTEALKFSFSHLKELDLRENKLKDSGLKKLEEFLNSSGGTLKLWNSISDESCADVASALCTNPSHIRYLDLSECKLGDSGVKKLCDLLKKHECKLETLRLVKCSITEGGAALTEALRLNSSHLKELDLSENELKDSVLQELQEILQSSGGKLQSSGAKIQYHKSWTQTFTGAGAAVWSLVSGITGSKSDEQTTSKPKSFTVQKEQREGLKQTQQSGSSVDSNVGCSMEDASPQGTLRTCKILSDESCADVASALCTNPSHIIYLDLSECKLGDSGVKKLCDLLKKDECKLEKLRLKQCRISDGSCSALTEALKLHSHLKELDLRNTKVNDAVKKQLSEILERSGGSLITDKLSWMKSKLPRPGKKQDTATSDPKSSTAQGEERDGKMQDTERGGSDVDSNADNRKEEEEDDDDQQDQDSKGTVTDVYIPDPQTEEISV
ncbi:protein NLRC5 isoform X14 [Silurus meridionalis]|nr:protein NLRC5 isoform X14 [Silurus meridionalis]